MNLIQKVEMLNFLKITFCLLILCGAVSTGQGASSEDVLTKLLVENPTLQDKDAALNSSYQNLKALLDSASQKKLLQEQREWLKKRNKHLGDIQALQRFYEERQENLQARAEALRASYEKDLFLVVNTHPTLDFQDPKVQAYLTACPLAVCQIYRALMISEVSPPSSKETQEARGILSALIERVSLDSGDPISLSNAADVLEAGDLRKAALFLLSTEAIEGTDRAPLWLVRQYPEILEMYPHRRPPQILAENSIEDIPEFEVLAGLIDEMYRGRFVTTAYCPHQGTIELDLGGYYGKLKNDLSFLPTNVPMSGEHKTSFPNLYAWSLKGIWNRLTYQKFLKAFEAAVPALKTYYKSHAYLKEVAPQAPSLLAFYVNAHFDRDPEDSKALNVLLSGKTSLADLKTQTTDFTPQDWDELLHCAILAGFSLETLAWILDAGAHVNQVYKGETALMNAVTRPDVMILLLKRGADVHQKNPFGKTALFYAIQFGDQKAVELLLQAGARVNEALDSLAQVEKRFEETYDTDYLIEKVVDFTPLVYALRYGSDEVVSLLIQKGATLGRAPLGRIREWVLMNPQMTLEKLDARLKIINKK